MFMKKQTVGIPRALLFYYEKDLWLSFFEQLNVGVVLSDPTNRETLKMGEKKCIDEACLSLKIYLGHIENLIGKCDYIFIPRLYSIRKTEQVCTNFNCLYDLVHNLYPNLSLIHYNIDLEHGKKESSAYIHLGEQLGFSYIESYKAYVTAKKIADKKRKKRIKAQEKKLYSKKIKVLLAGHPYNLYDSYISESIIRYLKSEHIEIIYSNLLDFEKVDEECSAISSDIHWTHSKQMVAGINFYAPKVDGIILISSFPCGPDSLTVEMIKRKVDCPILYLVFENENSETGIATRLESFFDILSTQKEVNHERSH